MPETTLKVRWPDATERGYYSPSTIVHMHFKAGETYDLADFVAASRKAYHEASERVRAKYGMACGSAAAELSKIERDAAGFAEGRVAILP